MGGPAKIGPAIFKGGPVLIKIQFDLRHGKPDSTWFLTSLGFWEPALETVFDAKECVQNVHKHLVTHLVT